MVSVRRGDTVLVVLAVIIASFFYLLLQLYGREGFHP